MYWNKAVAKELGITSAPTTIAELEKDMKLAKAAGVTPMIMPAKEGGTSYIYQALWTNNSGKDTVQKWILQKKNATINEKGAIAAATTIQKWQTSGYFSSDANALDGTTALSRFTGSQGLFFPSGIWYSASIYKALGDDAGFFAYPGTTSSQKASAASNAVTAFGIPANAKHKNAAAAFLNFLLSDEARQISVDYGYPAIGTGTTPSTDNTVLSEILTAYDGLVESGNTTDYINNATAAMQASGIIPNFQTLLDGSMTPKAFVQAIQKQYDSELD